LFALLVVLVIVKLSDSNYGGDCKTAQLKKKGGVVVVLGTVG
jgi:hypothetical protein